MPALNFQERFAELVESGKKRQTIRRVWKRPIKPWDMLYLYTGMRTKHCRSLGISKCCKVHPITIPEKHLWMWPWQILVTDAFARRDGFADWPEMREWFKKRYGLPFEGVLIQWQGMSK